MQSLKVSLKHLSTGNITNYWSQLLAKIK